jgi:hypothetical protein
VNQGQYQQIQFGPAQFPVGSIQRQRPRAFDAQERSNQASGCARVDVEAVQEALQAFVTAVGQGRAWKGRRDLGQADRLDREECDQEAGQELDAGAIPACSGERPFDTIQFKHRGVVKGGRLATSPYHDLTMPCYLPTAAKM